MVGLRIQRTLCLFILALNKMGYVPGGVIISLSAQPLRPPRHPASLLQQRGESPPLHGIACEYLPRPFPPCPTKVRELLHKMGKCSAGPLSSVDWLLHPILCCETFPGVSPAVKHLPLLGVGEGPRAPPGRHGQGHAAGGQWSQDVIRVRLSPRLCPHTPGAQGPRHRPHRGGLEPFSAW